MDGGSSSSCARRVCGPCWSAFRGSPVARDYGPHGFAGLTDTDRVLFLGPENPIAVLDTERPLQGDVLDLVVESFQFTQLEEAQP